MYQDEEGMEHAWCKATSSSNLREDRLQLATEIYKCMEELKTTCQPAEGDPQTAENIHDILQAALRFMVEA